MIYIIKSIIPVLLGWIGCEICHRLEIRSEKKMRKEIFTRGNAVEELKKRYNEIVENAKKL